jgi:hypothetical protein
MEKDPDEATVISSGSGRDFSGEKEHLVLGGPGHQGNGISSGMHDGHAAAGRRRSGRLLLLETRRLQEPALIWPGELPCLHPRQGPGLSSRTAHDLHAHVIPGCTASSPSNPNAPQSASRAGRKRLADTIFPQQMHQL